MTGCPRIVIGGTHSGVGKTSITLALVMALRRQGLKVQTFKVGPDFLDPTYLSIASGRPCYNLDGWMMGCDYVQSLFARASADADIAVVEGVMGLFDGSDAATSEGSTAEIARWLDAPVVLVVNAHGMARSIAAMVKGYVSFEPDIKIAGVIANQCGSDRHAAWLEDSLESASLPPLVGAIPRGAFPELPSRHLGLVTADDRNLPVTILNELAAAVEKHTTVDGMLMLAESANPLESSVPEVAERNGRVRIGVAHDEAFHFYYQDTFDAMERLGCEFVRFSPIRDDRLPENLDGLYIGGGYPEMSAPALSDNQSMLDSVRRFADSGRPVYAECGGLMYLSQGLEMLDENRFPMVGLLPSWTRMRKSKKVLGYVEVTLDRDSLWGVEGDTLRGHEFHYSELIDDPSGREGWETVYSIKKRRSDEITPEGYQRGMVLASYAHLHLGSRPEAIERFIVNCEAQSKMAEVVSGEKS